MRRATREDGEAARPAGASAEAPLVLLVDDVADNRTVYAMYLRFEGFRVEEAENGQEAIERVVRTEPSIVVMDLSLPVMDGWEATRRLRAEERTRRIPIVALTGHALADHAARAKEAGCDAVVTKPLLPEDLVKLIRSILERAPSRSSRGR